MSLQGQLNQLAFDQLPAVNDAIDAVSVVRVTPNCLYDRLINHALRKMSNSHIAIDDMSEKQKKAFSKEILNDFQRITSEYN